ncbi:Glycerol-3-phosphate dehydrogenase [NAD(P)+] [Frankliniella fusca]|uniref:Glycerol-3-phosphate dehydrogenase [NAD(P)+] n=1 Tax=Frankliniella fusca TaxID=407009 RepID=A0AAE1HEJ1_9NEOP|nr:Glycerol-3-phosphate dehydrogenase [NAD(P)+] [Frankliniella fusca]
MSNYGHLCSGPEESICLAYLIPHSISELTTILEDPAYEFLNSTLDGEDFLCVGKFGQSSQNTSCLMFASQRMLQYMSLPDSPVLEVLSDANFCVPVVLDGRQLRNICTIRRNHVIVLVRFLMQSKSEVCYKVCLEALKVIVPDFKPRTVMYDFESAQCNAWETVYPLATLSGCLFHRSKVSWCDKTYVISVLAVLQFLVKKPYIVAIALHAQELGLVPLIRANETVDSIVCSLCALALLPVDSLVTGLECISNRCYEEGLFDTMEPMLNYMLRTWFQQDCMRRLSVYGCADRTSNACESANATFASACGTKKPSVYTFLCKFII